MSSKPSKLRNDFLEYSSQQVTMARLAKDLFEAFRPDDIYPSCLTCRNFDHKPELCKIATPPQRPPADIIVRGCPMYRDADEIPF